MPTHKIHPSFFKNLVYPTYGLVRNRSDKAFNGNRFLCSGCKLDSTSLRTDRRTSGKKEFKKFAVQLLNQIQFSYQTLV